MGGLRLLLDGSEGQPSSNPDRSLDEATPCSQARSGRFATCAVPTVAGGARCGGFRDCPLETGQDRCEWHGSGTADKNDDR
jgi:hypothetical protein